MVGIYFSGTGNSKYCIEAFVNAYELGSKCVSIEHKECIEVIKASEELVFAYPIYYSNLPKIVHDFIIENKAVFQNKKIFIICTMGLFSGDGAGCAARLFKKYGANILGGLHVKMPDCIGDEKALKKTPLQNYTLVETAKQTVIEAAKGLREGKQIRDGLRGVDHLAGLFGQRLWFYNKTKTYTNKMKVDSDKCSGCGICTTLCPLSNIELKENKAISKGTCTMCYRCFAHCPNKAITILGNRVHEQCHIEKYTTFDTK